MHFKYLTVAAAMAMGISTVSAQEIATWAGFRSGVATFTFDDGCANQLSIAVPIFDKYGYKASFYIVNNWGPNYSAYQKLAEQGYEIGSHSDSHAETMPDAEIASSKNTINSKITNQQCNTITYPNCNEPSETLLAQNYIGGRICSGQIDAKTPQNYYRISSIICGESGSVNTVSAFQSKMQEAIQKNGWVTFLIHEVDKGTGYSPTSSAAIDGALSWAKQNDGKIWVTTFRNAIMYSKERDASKLEAVSGGTAGTATYKLTNSLSTTLAPFDYPLSIRVKNSNNWTSVSGTQNGTAIDAKISDGYIYFDAVPNAGNIVLSSGNSGVTPGSSSSAGDVSNSSASTNISFNGPIAIPGTVEAENYDVNAFSDSDGKNDATGYREDDAGIIKTSTGYALGYTNAGDYFEYTLNVASAGKYKVSVRGATGNASPASISLSAGASSVNVSIPNTANDWETYSEVDGGELELLKGPNTLRLTIQDNYVNVDWIKLSSDSATTAILQMKLDARPLAVYSDGKNIIASGAEGERITVFNSLGHVVFKGRGESHEQVLVNGAKGVYIVRISGKSFTVNLK